MILAELFPYANVVYNILTVLYVLTILAVIVVVLSENRNPVKSMAWVLVLLLLGQQELVRLQMLLRWLLRQLAPLE